VRTKANEIIVDNPGEAMGKFQSALSKLVKVPKTITRAKHKHTRARLKKTPKG
jgi:hypothetical protein